MKIEDISLAVLVFLFGIMVSFLLAYPVMWLWNYVVPAVSSLKPLTYWQAWGMWMLAQLLIPTNRISHK